VFKGESVADRRRDILSESYGTKCALVNGARGHVTAPDNLCTCDFTPGETDIPQDLEPAEHSRHWFLLFRQDLTAPQVAGTTDLNVLLKPVTRAVPRALLSGCKPHGNQQNGGSTGLVDAHQGRIGAESHHSVAVFSFVLPLRQAAARLSEDESSSEAACLAWIVEN
jgi:hypothetical protein